MSCSCSNRNNSALWALAALKVSSASFASASRSRLRGFDASMAASRRYVASLARVGCKQTASSERGDGVPSPVDAIAATRRYIEEEGRQDAAPHRSFASFSACNRRFTTPFSRSHLRGASRFGPNGLKIDKETTHVIVRWTRVASMA